jgi:Lon protease-like protein
MAATESGQFNGGVSGRISEIPLFPLDLVLFPQMVQPLHIFEERYLEMIHRCILERLPFGILLVSEADSSENRVETFRVGCTARIEHFEHLPDGRINIQIVGEERFRLLDTHERMSYRTGVAEFFDDIPAESETILALTDEVQKLLRDFFTRYMAMMGHELADDEEFDLPDNPSLLSFVAARALPITNEEKQALLAENDLESRLVTERDTLLREVTRLRRTAETQQIVWKPLAPDAFASFLCPN